MAEFIPGFGDYAAFARGVGRFMEKRRTQKSKPPEKKYPPAGPSIKYIARNQVEFERLESQVFAEIARELGDTTDTVVDYERPFQQHYIVLVDPNGSEVASRVFSGLTVLLERSRTQPRKEPPILPPDLTRVELDDARVRAEADLEDTLRRIGDEARAKFREGWGVSFEMRWRPGKRSSAVSAFNIPVGIKGEKKGE